MRAGPATPATTGPLRTIPKRPTLAGYYRRPAVGQRMAEYLGVEGASNARVPLSPVLLSTATAVYVTTPRLEEAAFRRPPHALRLVLAEAGEAARSLWDRSSLVAHLDLEHVHFDRPYQPLLEPARSFELQRPLVEALLDRLDGYGLEPLHLLTGRGHHLVWRIARTSRAFRQLSAMGRLTPELDSLNNRTFGPAIEQVGRDLGTAQDGLGKVLEFLAHGALRDAAPRAAIPLQLTAVKVGPGPAGREVVSLDLSLFGDPLPLRSVRLPFSAYRKASALGAPPELSVQPIFTVPVISGDMAAAVAARASRRGATRLARQSTTVIPKADKAMEALVADYRSSDLARFHRDFEAVSPEPRHRWAETYDRLDLEALPLCASRILAQPNDLLLDPAGIQLVTRSLLALGWHPRHIAGLIHSRYERDYGWIPELHFHSPRIRADFYTRLFAGMISTGADGLLDLNCRSTLEKGLCPGTGCDWNLVQLGDRLRESRRDG